MTDNIVQKAIVFLLGLVLIPMPGRADGTLVPDGATVTSVELDNQQGEVTSLEYVVRAGDTLIKIASRHRSRTNHYGLTDLLDDIRGCNHLDGDLLRPGQRLRIPFGPEPRFAMVQQPVTDGSDLRGIYFTGPMFGYAAVFDRIDRFIQVGGNGIVFDVKDIDGGVSYRSSQALARPGKNRNAPFIPSLAEMMRRLEQRELYVVARIALFLDGELGRQRPDLALTDEYGSPWTERGCAWIDPARDEARAYNIGLAVELAAAGVDEIQLDYVRYPTNGWPGYRSGDPVRDPEDLAIRRRTVIAGFLQQMHDALTEYDVRLSADLYGIVGWGRPEDTAVTGQHVATFAGYVDIICPMIYPSHFAPGFEGIERPADHPEYFIAEGIRRFQSLAGPDAIIRPWLQAFPYRVTDFDGGYILAQISAAATAGGSGWCLWSPTGRYDTANAVLPGYYRLVDNAAGGKVPDVRALP